ncbi:TPA: hypothetical protein ACTW4A_002117 [Klebsiella pneumoniae]
MTDITELTSVQKNANIHRLSRLIAYAPNDELRQMAVEVEHYTDQLIEALEKAKGMEAYWKTQCRGITDHCEELQARITELEESNAQVIQSRDHYKRMTEEGLKQLAESRTVKLPAKRFCPAEYAGSQLWSETEVWNKAITACADALRAAGIKVEAD